MTYQLYRNTTLGSTLQESLDELIEDDQITPTLALKVLIHFDKIINNSLDKKVQKTLTFNAGKLTTYRFCDNVWTLLLTDAVFFEKYLKGPKLVTAKALKIVACDGKASTPP